MSVQRKLFFFVLKVFLVILVFSSFWPFVAPSYTSVLTMASDAVSSDTLLFNPNGTTIHVQIRGVAEGASLYTMPLQGGLLLLMALILVTPGVPIVRRLAYAVLGGAIIFGIHIISILVLSHEMLSMRPLVVLFASVGIDLFPVLVWLLFSARYWWPEMRQAVPVPVVMEAEGGPKGDSPVESGPDS